jgi:hypothetical protein
MRSCTVKLDEENPKYASLAQENGFASTKLIVCDAVADKRCSNTVHLLKGV